jgi:hypothetical protein
VKLFKELQLLSTILMGKQASGKDQGEELRVTKPKRSLSTGMGD